ncbi:hypothetical protein Tco_1119647, partial [Tanacetum coccineum]
MSCLSQTPTCQYLTSLSGSFPCRVRVLEMKDSNLSSGCLLSLSKSHKRQRVDMVEYSLKKVLIFVEDSWNEEPCSDVHQVGDERKVEVLRSFKWPPSELITDDGVLPERGYSQFNDVRSGYLCIQKSPSLEYVVSRAGFLMFGGTEKKVRAVALVRRKVVLKDFTEILRRKSSEVAQPQVNSDSTIAQFGTGRAVWHDRALWHEPEEFSSKLNNISLWCVHELYTVQRSIQRCVQEDEMQTLINMLNMLSSYKFDSTMKASTLTSAPTIASSTSL